MHTCSPCAAAPSGALQVADKMALLEEFEARFQRQYKWVPREGRAGALCLRVAAMGGPQWRLGCCAHVCAHILAHTCKHTHACTCGHARIYTHTPILTKSNVPTCLCTQAHASTHACVRAHLSAVPARSVHSAACAHAGPGKRSAPRCWRRSTPCTQRLRCPAARSPRRARRAVPTTGPTQTRRRCRSFGTS